MSKTKEATQYAIISNLTNCPIEDNIKVVTSTEFMAWFIWLGVNYPITQEELEAHKLVKGKFVWEE